MHTMLDKQPRSDAIAKKKARDNMTYEEVPPTTPGKTGNFTCKKNNYMQLLSGIFFAVTSISTTKEQVIWVKETNVFHMWASNERPQKCS